MVDTPIADQTPAATFAQLVRLSPTAVTRNLVQDGPGDTVITLPMHFALSA